MCSDVSITDFDSDEDVAWSVGRVSDDDHLNLNLPGSISNDSGNLSASTSQSCRVREFGEFEENHGWIQCPSKAYPDRVYFHNTHSGCNTWYRPISRYVDIPFVSVKRAKHTDDEPANLDLMSVSDDEKESGVSTAASDRDRPSIGSLDIMARCYYTPQMDPTSDTDNPCRLVDAFVSECCNESKQIHDENDENNNINDSKTERPSLCVTNFLETEFFVEEGEVDIERKTTRISKSSLNDNSSVSSASPPRAPYVVYRVPRLKKISFEDQLIKPRRRTRVSKVQGPRKIICDMYGVRTINYDLPGPDQMRTELGVKSSTLSESDSDADKSPSSSRRAKTTRSFESEWRDIEKNLHQPLLSDSSSSPSSRSDTNNSSMSSSTSSNTCSCSTCSSCS